MNDDQTDGATVRRLMDDFSIEVTPREADTVPEAARLLRPRAAVYVTYLPQVPFDRVVSTADRIREAGLRPVVHIAVRAIPDLRAMDSVLGALADVGVRDILLIAGSMTSPAGSIENTIQVLESDCLHRRQFDSIGVAGHPEGNPVSDPAATDDAIVRKNKIAAETGLPLHIVTQFCFAPQPIVRWERRLRDEGNTLPVHVGLPGLTTPAKLIRFGLSCGVGASLTMLRKQSGSVLRLATQTYRPTDTVAGVATAVARDTESLIAGFHFFPFGAVGPTTEWATAVRDGTVEVV